MASNSRINANIHSNIKKAHGATAILIFDFLLATIIIVILMNILALYIAPFVYNLAIQDPSDAFEFTPEKKKFVAILVTALTTIFLLGSWASASASRGNATGPEIIESLGGTRVPSNTTDFQERQLLDIVQELSSQFGIAMPPVYIENDNSINACAAGKTPETSAVSVTRGSMYFFTREELRAVLGHELGHIINGDSILKTNMCCAATGFLTVQSIGQSLLRTATSPYNSSQQSSGANHSSLNQGVYSNQNDQYNYQNQQSRKGEQAAGGAAAVVVLALGTLALGYIGFQVAQLIFFAVSRQREFLADLSSAKFTGAEAMAHSLMKIKLFEEQYAESQSACTPERAAYAQFYFAPVSSWYRTHPSTDERIRKLIPGYNGVIPAYIKQQFQNPPGLKSENTGNSNSSAGSRTNYSQFSESRSSLAGNSTQTRVQQASSQESSKSSIIEYIRDPYSARCAIFALLIDSNQDVRINQWAYLQNRLASPLLQMVQKILPVAINLSCAEKIQLAESSIYALQQMSISQYKEFRSIVNDLTAADQRLDLFELTLRALITGRLDGRYGLNKNAVTYTDSSQIANEFQVVLGYIAYSGASNPSDVSAAIAHVCKTFNFSMSVPAKSECTLSAFSNALQKIQLASTPIKTVFFNTFIECVNYDGKVTEREREIVYAIGAALNLRFDLD